MLPINTLHITYLYGRMALLLVKKCSDTHKWLSNFSAFIICCSPTGETNLGPISLQKEPCQGIKDSDIYSIKKILRHICSYWWILENAYSCWFVLILFNLSICSSHHCQGSDFQRSLWVLPSKVLWFSKNQLFSLCNQGLDISVPVFSSVCSVLGSDHISFCMMIFYAHESSVADIVKYTLIGHPTV